MHIRKINDQCQLKRSKSYFCRCKESRFDTSELLIIVGSDFLSFWSVIERLSFVFLWGFELGIWRKLICSEGSILEIIWSLKDGRHKFYKSIYWVIYYKKTLESKLINSNSDIYYERINAFKIDESFMLFSRMDICISFA